MKVLQITESYWPNADGGALFERRLVQGLQAQNINVAVWAPGKFRHSYKENDGRYMIYREKSLTLLFNRKYRVSFWPWRSVKKIIDTTKPDVIHIHNAGLMGLAGMRQAKKRGIPVVATNHFMPENFTLNVHFPGKRRFSKWLIWKYLAWFHNRCDFVTSPTPTAVRLLQLAGLASPAKAISNGIDTHKYIARSSDANTARKYHIPTDKKVILYLGRVDGEKRIDVIIRSLKRLSGSSDAVLVIAGYGKAEPSLKSLATSLSMGNRVIFTGYIDEKDKPKIYNLGDVFVISSPAELQSIVLLEAMSSSLPVVAVNVAALSELCRDNLNGFLFDENNSAQLAKKLELLLVDKELRTKFGRASRHIVETEHSNEHTIAEYIEVYNKVTSKEK